LTKSDELISATRSFREPFFTHNCHRKGIRISGQNVQKWDFLTDAWPIEEGIDGKGRALACTIPCSAWVLQRKTEAKVSLIYRNDDGVDVSTLSPIPCPDQRKRGHVFSPSFFLYFVADRPEYGYQQKVPWQSNLAAQVGGSGQSRSRITRRSLPVLHAETARLCGFRAASLQRYALVVTRLGQRISRIGLRSTPLASAWLDLREHPPASA